MPDDKDKDGLDWQKIGSSTDDDGDYTVTWVVTTK